MNAPEKLAGIFPLTFPHKFFCLQIDCLSIKSIKIQQNKQTMINQIFHMKKQFFKKPRIQIRQKQETAVAVIRKYFYFIMIPSDYT